MRGAFELNAPGTGALDAATYTDGEASPVGIEVFDSR